MPISGKTVARFKAFSESQGQNLALTVLYVPYSLDSGARAWRVSLHLSMSLSASLSLALSPSLSLSLTNTLPLSHLVLLRGGRFRFLFHFLLQRLPFRSGFKVQGAGCRVQGSGFRVWGVGREVWGLGFGVWGSGFGVWCLGFGVWGLGFGVGVWGLGFRVWTKIFGRFTICILGVRNSNLGFGSGVQCGCGAG